MSLEQIYKLNMRLTRLLIFSAVMCLPFRAMCEPPGELAPVEFKSAVVDGLNLFYREAGPKGAPVIVLLHGFPSSSTMFSGLLPRLGLHYHVIAPDHPGFGHSDAPSPGKFTYTFDHLADSIDKLLGQLSFTRYALYMQDYGGPVGFRIAIAHAERVTALIIQNAAAYEEGLSDVWELRRAFWKDRAATESKMRESFLIRCCAATAHRRQRPTGAHRSGHLDDRIPVP